MVAKHDAKKEEKISANLEAKFGTYLEVKHGAKREMDAILDVNLDTNMVLLRIQLWH